MSFIRTAWVICLCVCFSTVSTVNAQSESTPINDEYEAAVVHYQDKAYKEAFLSVQNVLRDSPDYLPAYILLGSLYFDNGLLERADRTYQLALDKGADPNLIFHNWADVLLKLRKAEYLLSISFDNKLNGDVLIDWFAARASACLQLGRSICAKREYDEILARAHNHPKGLNGLALLAIDNGLYENADSLLNTSMENEIKRAETLWAKGVLEKAKGNLVDAQHFFNEAFLLAPNDARVARSLIDAYVAAADLDAALLVTEDLLLETKDDLYVMFVNSWLTSQLDTLSNIRPQLEMISQRLSTVPDDVMKSEPSLFYLRGMVALMQRNFEQARDNFMAYTVYADSDLQTAILLATANMALGDQKAATLGLQDHEDKLVKENLQQAILLGSLYLQNKRIYKAVNLLEKLQAQYGERVEVALFAVRISLARGKSEDAVSTLDSLLSSFEHNRQVLQAYALYFLDNGNSEKANVAIALLLEQFPDDLTVKNIRVAQLLMEKRLDEAEPLLMEVLTASPNLFAARYNHATLLVNRNKLEEAKAILEALEVEKSNDFQVLLQLANINVREGNVELAVSRYNTLLQRYGPSLNVTFAAVAAFNQTGDYQRAISALKSLEANEPNNALAIVQLATFYIKVGDKERAKSTLMKLTLIFDRPVNVLVSESQNWLALGDTENAYQSMQKAHKMQPDNLNLQLQWVKLLMALNKVADAQSILNDLLSRNTKNPFVLFKMGELAQLKGELDQARSYFEAVLDEDTSFDLAYAKLYAVSVNTQSFETFLERLSQRVELEPTRYFTRNLLAQYHFYYGNAEQARLHYDVLLKSAQPDTQYAIYNRLAILTLSSEPENSLALATEAYKRNPTNADVLHTYGWALTVNNKAQEALPILREASVRDATSLSLQYHLAYTLANIGNRVEAKRILITLLNKDEVFAQKQQAQDLLAELNGAV
ncbi:MAG: hypothetical protein AXW14_05720 [Alteromonas sp. Nap_26]|nr:MAG: hypothetical protein AXW14_05720 [Alteromonas sp. Nap_26]